MWPNSRPRRSSCLSSTSAIACLLIMAAVVLASFLVLHATETVSVRRLSPAIPRDAAAFKYAVDSAAPVPAYARAAAARDWRDSLPLSFPQWSFDENALCPLCGPPFPNVIGNSAPRDLVLGLMTGITTNAITFVRTLRSVKCLASVVLFVDDQFLSTLGPKGVELMSGCGVTLLNLGKLLPPYADHVFEIRHVFYYDFLVRFRDAFDRVIVVDVADTVFQMDPFTVIFTGKIMAATSEFVTLNADETNNTAWIRIADPEYAKDASFYDDRVALNAGFLYGSMEGFMHFYEVFITIPAFDNFTFQTIDQGYLNFLYYRGHFQRAGLDLKVSHPGDQLLSVRGISFLPDQDKLGKYRVKGFWMVPAAIHQYNRICPILKKISTLCPRLDFDTGGFPVLKQVTQPCRWAIFDRLMQKNMVAEMETMIARLHNHRPPIHINTE
jgi:hypothetical protein